eukprot:CAMPEP_0175845704 /NCGR_PEP_ID=MMETSP0107_2-20121207/22369_1 /TAXON_ID=195067 ORGANISM="Goniomonas pacifica, Strain CCMP1869" /NCGR_SAMPLE_ID=MMETSP0107_2 /ASSEMBLY_ACC=CAM_ASM_000203 /LENGTH=34 /DNA_ID= /DNA_START= /DNA_END= /DNA_ORIENTATION=
MALWCSTLSPLMADCGSGSSAAVYNTPADYEALA